MKGNLALGMVIIQAALLFAFVCAILLAMDYVCGDRAEILCDDVVLVGAVIAVFATAVALVGTNIIAWLIYRAQAQADDDRHRMLDKRLADIESKIEKISGKDGGQEDA